MAPKRKIDTAAGWEQNETITRRNMEREEMFSDEHTGTIWKFVSPSRIAGLLGTSPSECPVIKMLGLGSTMSFQYEQPIWDMVKEFIVNFDTERGGSDFRGSFLELSVDVLREAFKLPTGSPNKGKERWNGVESDVFFKRSRARGGKYILDWLRQEYKHWEGPLRVVNELLLGRRRPSACSGKLMWYFSCYSSYDVQRVTGTKTRPEDMPDWGELMHQELMNELSLVKIHLVTGADPKKKKVQCYLGTAVMQILTHFSHKSNPAVDKSKERMRSRARKHRPAPEHHARDASRELEFGSATEMDIEGSNRICADHLGASDGTANQPHRSLIARVELETENETGIELPGTSTNCSEQRKSYSSPTEENVQNDIRPTEGPMHVDPSTIIGNVILDYEETGDYRVGSDIGDAATFAEHKTPCDDYASPECEFQDTIHSAEMEPIYHNDGYGNAEHTPTRTDPKSKGTGHIGCEGETEFTTGLEPRESMAVEEIQLQTSDALNELYNQISESADDWLADAQLRAKRTKNAIQTLQQLGDRALLEAKDNENKEFEAKLSRELDSQNRRHKLIVLDRDKEYKLLQNQLEGFQAAQAGAESRSKDHLVVTARLKTELEALTATQTATQSELVLQSKRVSQLMGELKGVEDAEGRARSELIQQQQELKQLKSELDSNRDTQIESQTRLVSQNESMLQLREELKRMRDALAQAQAQLIIRDSDIREEEAELGRMKTAQDDDRKHSTILNEKTRKLENDLEEMKEAVIDARSELISCKEKNTQLEGDLETMTVARVDAELQVDLRNARISELKSDLEKREAAQADAQTELGLRKAKVFELEGDLEKLKGTLAAAQTKLGLRDARILDLEGELEKSKAALAAAQNELNLRDARILQLEDDLNGMKGILSKAEAQEKLTRGELVALEIAHDILKTGKDAADVKLTNLQEQIDSLTETLKSQCTVEKDLSAQLKSANFKIEEAMELRREAQDALKESAKQHNTDICKLRLESATHTDLVNKNKETMASMERSHESQTRKQQEEIASLRRDLKASQSSFLEAQNLIVTMADEESSRKVIRELQAAGEVGPSGAGPSSVGPSGASREGIIDSYGGGATTGQNADGEKRVETNEARCGTPEIGAFSDDDEEAAWAVQIAYEPEGVINGSDLVEEAEAPKGHLLVVTKDHQKKGLAWMIKRESAESISPRGGILADDQGMGKTIQAIALILSQRPKGSCTLVVCPALVVDQWIKELETKCSSSANMKVFKYMGTSRYKVDANFADYTVVVTSYPTLEVDWKTHKGTDGERLSPIYLKTWHRVVLDECQNIKNYKGQTSSAVSQLSSTMRWCMSGTPLQNTVDDTYSYFRFLQYGPLENFNRFKKLSLKCSKNPVEGMAELKKHMSFMTLRRLKDDCLTLPEKKIRFLEVDFADESHRELYENIMKKSSNIWMNRNSKGPDKDNGVGKAFGLLLKGRMACVHPVLGISKKPSGSPGNLRKMEEVANSVRDDSKCQVCLHGELIGGFYVSETCKHLYCDACFNESPDDCESFPCGAPSCSQMASLISVDVIFGLMDDQRNIAEFRGASSSKIEAVMKYVNELPPISPGHVLTEKVIVFSQWTKALNLVQEKLKAASIKYERIDGKMLMKARLKALENFCSNQDVKVLLLSLMSGNAGLNIVAANHVVILDMWWNPTVEAQAVDRVHRIGQTRKVSVVRLIVKNTIEGRLIELQEKKLQMHATILDSDPKEGPKKPGRQKENRIGNMDFLLQR